MRPKQQAKARHDDMFRARLDQIINMKHALVALAGRIDLVWLDDELAGYFSYEGRPAEPVRFVLGMLLLSRPTISRTSRCGIAGCMIPISSTSPARRSSTTSSSTSVRA
jgi:hypothetical protein